MPNDLRELLESKRKLAQNWRDLETMRHQTEGLVNECRKAGIDIEEWWEAWPKKEL